MASVTTCVDLCEVALHKNHNCMAIKAFDTSPKGNQYCEVATLPIPAQNHLFVDSDDSGLKKEPHIPNGANLINRFDVICRFCLDENERLLDILGANDCVVVMTESLVDVKVAADDMLPKQICANCFEQLNQCFAFKQQVAMADTALRRCIGQFIEIVIGSLKGGGEVLSSGITEQRICDTIWTPKELSVGHKFEDLMEEEDYAPDYEMVCEKDLSFCSDYDKSPVEGDVNAIDYSPGVKSEPITSPCDVTESLVNVQCGSRTLVKCEPCDKQLSCNSILQEHIKSNAVEMLKHQCNVCSKGFSRQTVCGHMSMRGSPNGNAQEQTNGFTCAKCNVIFAVEHDLYIHGSIHPEDDKIRCRQCSKDFPNFTKLRRHVKTHYESKPIKCKKCGRGFPDVGSLMRHYRVHTNEPRKRKHVCKECGKGYFDSHTLLVHISQHTGEKPWVCTRCDKGFIDSRLLKRHMRTHANVREGRGENLQSSTLTEHLHTHTGEKSYKCPQCSKLFLKSTQLAQHFRRHTGGKPYKCLHCSKSFRNSTELTIHARTHTGEKPYKCSHCPKTFGQSSTLTAHVRTHTGEKPYECPHCSKSFTSSSELTRHVRIHTGEKPYKCPHCSKSFRNSAALTVHIRTHTGEKPYTCPHCSKAFCKSSNLTEHIRTHTGEKPYKCTHCSKSFRKSAVLTDHVRTHTGEKPYKCAHCSKSFRTSSALAIHVRKHTSKTTHSSHSCKICGKCFSHNKFEAHMRTHTGKDR